MRHYELLFILKPTLTEEEAKARVDFVKEVITKNGGEIATVVEMGTRKLAYKIQKYERGTYFVIYYKAPPALLTELTRNIRITEDIIRFLSVKYENKSEIAAWDRLCKGIKQTIKTQTREPRAYREPRAEKPTEEAAAEK
ncbi:30S ribosomal protein S6 [Campylobacter pinnipediorum]|uniref:Small ribosomal subunit protein bS6 n=1 Tax=Campylobacter pinnipediorum subsp. pinnipediorum TaxID=1660067 RepID=A0AAX0L973_9BACT|nr:30S ribosomal protein S6 [Campylobacter pinnipediorum]AQW81840.1 30S ribosomal protein S6 [Campylobacter pinnipediorum subsp. pinnipediorum]AQW83515.1 30S ribosomal protein S6 [Campylobacter pinnipediorum subsp. pinnipediorum]AQW85036.1 30S ribosomal protein S6 [Campylobacter pinnipediorum subsp. pinnipediorum]OPA76423.1 30S ribosomal protein S6 [Campylobacter pinnipediorum subsp. pinnipediorum]OPA79885.1 30S ribosomal protein S6 [Campylobacter pinnipediorum subsp. pinnipediorum]